MSPVRWAQRVNNNNEIKKLNNAHGDIINIIKYYLYDKYDIILSTYIIMMSKFGILMKV